MNQQAKVEWKPTTDYAVKKGKGQNPSATVNRSRRKLHKEVDGLRRFLSKDLKTAYRATVVRQVAVLLQNAQHRGPITNPHELRFQAANEFLQCAIALKPGNLLSVPVLWDKFTDIVREMKPNFAAELLNRPEHREAFTWQTAGVVAMVGNTITGKLANVLACRLTGPGKPPEDIMTTPDGKLAFFFEGAGGARVPVPKGFEVTWPILLCPGDRWRGSLVKDFSIGNAVLNWPPRDAEKLGLVLTMLFTWQETVARLHPRKRRRTRERP